MTQTRRTFPVSKSTIFTVWSPCVDAKMLLHSQIRNPLIPFFLEFDGDRTLDNLRIHELNFFLGKLRPITKKDCKIHPLQTWFRHIRQRVVSEPSFPYRALFHYRMKEFPLPVFLSTNMFTMFAWWPLTLRNEVITSHLIEESQKRSALCWVMSITVDSWIALTNFVTRPSYIGFGFNLKDTVILSNDLSPENGSAEVSRVFPRREDMSNDLQPIPVASLK